MDNLQSGSVALSQSQGVFARIIGIFSSPRATMEDIAARPSWVLPLVIMALALGLSGFFLKDLILAQALEEMSKNPNMTEAQIATATKVISLTSSIMPMIFIPVVYLIIAALFLFVGNVILGGEAKFKVPFSVVCWSSLISLLGSFINVPLMLVRGEMTTATSLAFLGGEDKKSGLFFLMSQIDLFNLWWLAVLGIGFAAAYKFTNQKGLVTVFVCWAIFVAVVVGLKAIF